MNILIPIISFERAGGNRVLSELATAWVTAGHTVDFLVDQRSPSPYFPTRAGILRFDGQGRTDAARSAHLGFAPHGNARSIYVGMTRALRRLVASYDVVLANHSLTAFPVAIALALCRSQRPRAYYYVQAYEPEYYALASGLRAGLLRMLSALSYRLPLTQIANSPIYLDHPVIRARNWIPPGLDPLVFHRRPHPPIEANPPRWILGTIGRHEPTKGTLHVLQAFERLARRNPDVHLLVAYGNLPEGWSHERATVVVPRSDAELAAYYRQVDIMIAPGTVQLGACHYPVLESMACGTPIITTGYLPADKSNAWIVPVADPDAIAAAVEDVIRQPLPGLQSRLDRAAKATERFHWDNVAAEMLALFQPMATDA